MENSQRDNLIKTLDKIESEILSKNVYDGLDAHGHLRYPSDKRRTDKARNFLY